jgi:hypothetical protein
VKPPLRTKSVGTKVSEAEFALLEERARGAGLTLSELVREALLAGLVELEAGEVVLAEVLALRSLFLNLSFRAGKEPMTEAEMRGLIERADGVKMQRWGRPSISRSQAAQETNERNSGTINGSSSGSQIGNGSTHAGRSDGGSAVSRGCNRESPWPSDGTSHA